MTVTLTPAQDEALTIEGDGFVTAAAGSGKTRVLTGRVLRAVLEQNIALSSIHAVTFTDRAAAEIKERLAVGLSEAERPDLLEELESAPIGTIHALCARYIRLFPGAAGVDPGFTVLDGTAQAVMLAGALRAGMIEWTTSDPAHPRIRARYGDARLMSLVRAALEAEAARPGLRVRFAESSAGPVDAAALRSLVDCIASAYSSAKADEGALDFDDLQAAMLRLLEDEVARLEIRSRVGRLLVDEFQDTNDTQVRILEGIGAGVMFAVGDEWQSIYRFRRADVAVFRSALAAAGERTIRMNTNFRSSPSLIDRIDKLFARIFGPTYDTVQAGRDDSTETLLDQHPARLEVVLGGPADEAAMVAEHIAQCLADGADPEDVALLLPRRTHAAVFEQALRDRGIPALRVGGQGYFDQHHVRDAIRLLQWVRNADDPRAAAAALSTPILRVSVDAMWDMAHHPGGWAAGLGECDEPGAHRAKDVHARLRELAADGRLVDLVLQAVEVTSPIWEPDEIRRAQAHANLRKLVEIAVASQRVGVSDLGEFLETIDAAASGAPVAEAHLADESSGAVRIMTVHAAKGLEFNHVVVADTGNRGRTGYPDLLIDQNGQGHFVGVDELGYQCEVGDELERLREGERADELAEAKRLAYVALTRARESLLVTGRARRSKSGSLIVGGMLEWLLPAAGFDATSCTCNDPVIPVNVGETMQSDLPASPSWPQASPLAEPPSIRAFEVVARWIEAHPEGSESAVVVGADSSDGPSGEEAARGTRLHRAAQRYALGDVPGEQGLPTQVVELLDRLRRHEVQIEVPFLARSNGSVSRGRFDMLVCPGETLGTNIVVELKTTLPPTREAAKSRHRDQLERYGAALDGIGGGILVLAELSEPGSIFAWRMCGAGRWTILNQTELMRVLDGHNAAIGHEPH